MSAALISQGAICYTMDRCSAKMSKQNFYRYPRAISGLASDTQRLVNSALNNGNFC